VVAHIGDTRPHHLFDEVFARRVVVIDRRRLQVGVLSYVDEAEPA
jgi:hypothetical protein